MTALRPRVVLLAVLGWTVVAEAQELRVETVWQAAAAIPLIEAADDKRRAARAKVMEKRGAFDVKLNSKIDWEAIGYYRPLGAEAGVEVSTPLRGLRMYGGYRFGRWHPVYKFDKETADGGELVAGLELPLWRDGATDPARTEVRVAQIGVRMADVVAAAKRLEVVAKAGMAHAKWVAMVHKMRIAQRLLDLANTRAEAIERRIEAGALPNITRVDNQRILAERRAKLEATLAKVVKQAAKLAPYLGENSPVDATRAPVDLPPPTLGPVPARERLRAAMMAYRPELSMLSLAEKQAAAQEDLAENQMAPNIDLFVHGSQGIAGGDKTISGTEVRVGVTVSIPLQRRKARGARDSAAATRAALDSERAWAVQQLDQELDGVLASLQAGTRRYAQTAQAITAADALLKATVDRFEAGATDLFSVYLREQTLAKALESRIDAWLALRMDRLSLRALEAVDACLGAACQRAQ